MIYQNQVILPGKWNVRDAVPVRESTLLVNVIQIPLIYRLV